MMAVVEIVRALRARVARAVTRAALPPAARIAVAISGGADSMTLADCALAALGPARVVLLHVDHQLRGPAAAAADRAAALALAAAHGAALHVLPVDVRGPGEQAARRARYAALAAAARAHDLALVLTGHTARDQAETVLMRIVRGTGPAGLAGIPRRRGRYLRPLLATTRAEIDAYVAARGLAVAHDATNDDPRFFRNRVRAALLPALAAENPQLEAALCRLADAAREWRTALAADADALLTRARRDHAFDAPTLAAATPAVAKLALARAAAAAGLAADGPHLRALVALVRAPTAGTRAIDLPGGRAIREYDRLAFERPAERSAAAADSYADLVIAYAEPYEVRTVRPGDRMRPARLRGRSRKLSDLYTDARVPRRRRAAARVIVRRADGAIVWAEHLGAAADTDIRVETTRTDGESTSLGR
jgi:tRNA(Ile)-lysidine synthase